MAISEFKRKRESATDISGMMEGRQFDKNSKNPALIAPLQSKRDEFFGNNGALRKRTGSN